jgi:hypothetical protein
MPDPDYRLIPLHDRKGNLRAHAIVDPDDFKRFGHLRWSIGAGGYVLTGRGCDQRRLHRLILGLCRGDKREGDHTNGDTLDNRRANLRIATKAENGQNRVGPSKRNTSGYRGVSYSARDDTWDVGIMVNGVRYRRAGFRDVHVAGQVAALLRAEHMPFATD